jgi:hypothetical protein
MAINRALLSGRNSTGRNTTWTISSRNSDAKLSDVLQGSLAAFISVIASIEKTCRSSSGGSETSGNAMMTEQRYSGTRSSDSLKCRKRTEGIGINESDKLQPALCGKLMTPFHKVA